jgi:hypothetical protein
MEWLCVFRATGPTDAWLVRDWLERNGIPVLVRNDLTSLRGEIPFLEAAPTVWVREEDRVRATEAMRAYDSPRLVHPKWCCATCGEENEANFGSCWQCSTDAPVP